MVSVVFFESATPGSARGSQRPVGDQGRCRSLIELFELLSACETDVAVIRVRRRMRLGNNKK
jgi:hypothetical protein